MRFPERLDDRRYRLGQYMTTEAVANTMSKCIQRESGWRIMDPACGDGNLLVAAVQEARQRGVEVLGVTGFDIDRDMADLARTRLLEMGIPTEKIYIQDEDFLKCDPSVYADVNVILANPPYGRSREYRFFEHCAFQVSEAESIFLVPLAFVDRVSGLDVQALQGRPLGVTTGHAIVRRSPEMSHKLKVSRETLSPTDEFEILTGIKIYEQGAGTPPQTKAIAAESKYTSTHEVPGWLPCVRTGDVQQGGLGQPRLWVDYGDHLAQPKTIDRFSGPRLIVRRVPIWKERQLAAVYTEERILAAGDLLVIKHRGDSAVRLRELENYINSPAAAAAMHTRRPSVALRDSFPKFSAKDLVWLVRRFEGSHEI